jgi:hypothetical protein
VVCPPCHDHLAEHFRDDPDTPAWDDGVGLTRDKEECLLENTGCVVCDKSHEAILENRVATPDNPCDSGFMEGISS